MTTDNRPRDFDPIEELLATTLEAEAERVRPDPTALQRIQNRTASPARARARGRWLLVSAAGLATAAVVTGIVVVANQTGSSSTPPADPNPTGPSPSVVTQGPTPATRQVTMVYADPTGGLVGTRGTTRSPRFTEVHTIDAAGDPTLAAIHEFLTSEPRDPDYVDMWAPGIDVVNVTTSEGVTTIALTGSPNALPGMVDGTSYQDVDPTQLLLLSAGIEGLTQFTYNGDKVDAMFDRDVRGGVTPDDKDAYRAPVSIDNITEGQTVQSPVTVKVSGNTYEGNVAWRLTDSAGATVDENFVTTSQGSWLQVPIALGALEPGTYTFTAWAPSGEDGSVMFPDDKTFTVE